MDKKNANDSLNKEIQVQDNVSHYYEHIRYSRSYSKFYQMWWTKKMLSMLSHKNLEGKILDNGCGTGAHFEELSKYSQDIVGLDFSAQMLTKAKTRIKRVVLANSEHLPFRNGTFNLVFSRSLLHHLPNPEVSISEISRVLKDEGEAVFSDTNSSLLSNMPRRIAKKNKARFSDSHKNFDDRQLLTFIKSCLHIDKVYYFGYVAYPLIGFPDLIDIFSIMPFKNYFAKSLIKLDAVISMLPVIRTQSWGIIIKASKRKGL